MSGELNFVRWNCKPLVIPKINTFDLSINMLMKEITVTELKQKIDNKEDFQLIDVRESFEYEMSNINGENIPLAGIIIEAHKISKDKPVIIQCRSGARSAAALMQLEKNFGFTNLYNLKGGILAWAAEIDPDMQVY
jgi:rhodanese-related sulfurtransferase